MDTELQNIRKEILSIYMHDEVLSIQGATLHACISILLAYRNAVDDGIDPQRIYDTVVAACRDATGQPHHLVVSTALYDMVRSCEYMISRLAPETTPDSRP